MLHERLGTSKQITQETLTCLKDMLVHSASLLHGCPNNESQSCVKTSCKRHFLNHYRLLNSFQKQLLQSIIINSGI